MLHNIMSQGEIGIVIVVRAFKEMGIVDVSNRTMDVMMKCFGERGEIRLCQMGFVDMVREILGSRQLFYGHESMEDLSLEQLKALCSHNWGKAALGGIDAWKEATDDEMRLWIRLKAEELVDTNVIPRPCVRWGGVGASKTERKAVDRIGAMFIAYKVKFWYWELFEMARKLVFTSLMAFVFRGTSAQVAVGLWASAQLTMKCQPYIMPSLNGMQVRE
jgi:hypothetical protein